jgi:uncharacterized protein (DUF1778 family)
MAISEAQKRATAKYHKKKYDRIELKVKKGNKAIIETAAEKENKSLNSYVAEAVDQKLTASGNPSINTGSLVYGLAKIMIADYDGFAIYREFDAKIKAGRELSGVDMLNLAFLPLMKNDIPQNQLADDFIRLAQAIPDKEKQNACIAIAAAFANKNLNNDETDSILEAFLSTDLGAMSVERTIRDERTEVAKKALKKGYNIDDIIELTDLDAETIKRLKAGT